MSRHDDRLVALENLHPVAHTEEHEHPRDGRRDATQMFLDLADDLAGLEAQVRTIQRNERRIPKLVRLLFRAVAKVGDGIRTVREGR
jgi:hypothetical protein